MIKPTLLPRFVRAFNFLPIYPPLLIIKIKMRINFAIGCALTAALASSAELELRCMLVASADDDDKSLLEKAIADMGGSGASSVFSDFVKGVKVGETAMKGLKKVCRLVEVKDRFWREEDGEPYPCWRKTQSRGMGKPKRKCPEGTEKSGTYCYPPCKAGFTGVGGKCLQNCPAGMSDQGSMCYRNTSGSTCPSGMETWLWWCKKGTESRA